MSEEPEQGVESAFFRSTTGVVAMRLYDDGKVMLGVQPAGGPEEMPKVMIELTPWMQQRLVKTIGFDYDVHTEQYQIAIDALQDVVESKTHEDARTLAKAALHEIEALDD